jgi:hypothetical protein
MYIPKARHFIILIPIIIHIQIISTFQKFILSPITALPYRGLKRGIVALPFRVSEVVCLPYFGRGFSVIQHLHNFDISNFLD